jgi:tetratricopeptide (TPR) repeat protein
MLSKLAAILFLFLFHTSFGQYRDREQKLINAVHNATNDSLKIVTLGSLAEFYYIYGADSKGDSVLQKQLLAAELSNNKNLIYNTLFGNAITSLGRWTSQQTFESTLSFLDKGLSYAIEQDDAYFESLAYIRKAGIQRKQLQFDKAVQTMTLAYSVLDKLDEDSLKSVFYIELGDISLARGETVLAYKYYNTAYDFAYGLTNASLLSTVFHRYASLYNNLGDSATAMQHLISSLEINTEYNRSLGLAQDYIDIARLTDDKEYIIKALKIADSVKSEYYQLYSKKLMLAYLMVKEHNDSLSLKFLESNDDLKQAYLNKNLDYEITIANIYRYSGKFDSAIVYYSKTIPFLHNTYDVLQIREVNKELAVCYESTGQYTDAIKYYERALDVNNSINGLSFACSVNQKLGNLYARTGDFKKAFNYNQKYIVLNDSLQTLSNQRDVVHMEVDRENLRHQKDLEVQARESIRQRNIQYVGISIVITSVFFIMMLIGAFPVSQLVIKMLGFFAFICLFEFIVLLIDSYLHKLTHGEPLKIWLIKIFLILMLVPLQHYLEHGMVKFLASQKLIRMRKKLSIKKWIKPFRKPIPKVEPLDIEKDTAVL